MASGCVRVGRGDDQACVVHDYRGPWDPAEASCPDADQPPKTGRTLAEDQATLNSTTGAVQGAIPQPSAPPSAADGDAGVVRVSQAAPMISRAKVGLPPKRK